VSGLTDTCLLIVLATTIALAWCNLTQAEVWPALPDADREVMIPAQEWPRDPGPRTVKVYVYYPGGALADVDANTGVMLSLHNWGGTGWTGTANPEKLVERYNVVTICVDYLQSGPYGDDGRAFAPYDHGYLQALDALRALYFVLNGLETRGVAFAEGRIYTTGGSGGGNVTLMANKLAPRTFACAIDISGMAKLSDDIAFGIPGRTCLNGGYSPDPESPAYLNPDNQAIRSPGHPEHVATMKALGNTAKLLVVHGTADEYCPAEDAQEMVKNMQAAGLDVEPHFITEADIDGKVFTGNRHNLGDRTLRVFQFADKYLTPDSPDALVKEGPTDFECKDAKVRYETPNGAYVISYESGFPVGRFERS
jgi:predicted esterase